MECRDYKYMMLDQINGTLSRSDKIDLERHLLECPSCFQSFQKLRGGNQSDDVTDTGLFWYLLKPSGGYKTIFLMGAFCIMLLFMTLMFVYIKYPFLFKF